MLTQTYQMDTPTGTDTERFQLIANETVKVGTPVNRNDADYWISQFTRLGAIGEGERVGRVKVQELTNASEEEMYYGIGDMTEEQLEDYLNRDEPDLSSIICPRCGSVVPWDEPCWDCAEQAEFYQPQEE